MGGAAADVAAPAVGQYDFPPVPSFRFPLAFADGVEATQ
jgi:hypothetical protein